MPDWHSFVGEKVSELITQFLWWSNQFLGHENGKQLLVTTIKITESKENKSIHRLDLSFSTGPGGAAAPALR